MFDPNEHRAEIEKYLGHYLECQVGFIRAKKLTKSTREAPWQLDVEVNGAAQSYVLQLDPKNIAHEYQILKGDGDDTDSHAMGIRIGFAGRSIGSYLFF